MLSKQVAAENQKNRQYLLVWSSIPLLAHQGLPLRGDSDDMDSNLQLMVLRGEDYPVIHQFLWRQQLKYISRGTEWIVYHGPTSPLSHCWTDSEHCVFHCYGRWNGRLFQQWAGSAGIGNTVKQCHLMKSALHVMAEISKLIKNLPRDALFQKPCSKRSRLSLHLILLASVCCDQLGGLFVPHHCRVC